jgi:hypothetical protein
VFIRPLTMTETCGLEGNEWYPLMKFFISALHEWHWPHHLSHAAFQLATAFRLLAQVSCYPYWQIAVIELNGGVAFGLR